MINAILKYPLFYRLYQKTVRTKYSEYDFIQYVFSKLNAKIRMLDLCCGDSFILNFVGKYVEDYLGADNNQKYLNHSEKKWPKFNFLNMDLTDRKNLEKLKELSPNFIFINGAIHHLNDETDKTIISIILSEFKQSFFLSVDPIHHNNKLINSVMLALDRGKHIRNEGHYRELMKGYKSFIIDDFYKMSFQNIFHYQNFELKQMYLDWKNTLK